MSKSQYLALTTSGSPTLAQIRSQNWPPALDLGLLATQPRGIGIGDESFKFTLKHLARAQPADVRAAAADVMARVDLQQDQLVALAAAFKTLGPLEIPRVLPAFAQVKQAGVGLALVKALLDPAVRAAVRTEQVKPILDKYPQAVRSEAEKLYAALAEARKDESAKLERLLREMPAGDIRRGQLVFNNAKVQCTACHKVGYVGGLVGPDLTRIGRIRTERDLLESIVFPSASFVRSYEPVRIVTVDGRTFSGVVKNDAPDEIILVVAADKEERIARADIETIAPATVSVMPAGLDQQLTPQDLADLVAFLKACQ